MSPRKIGIGFISVVVCLTGGVAAPSIADSIDAALNPTPEPVMQEIDAAAATDAAVLTTGPPMIRCDTSYSCVGIKASPRALANDANVYVRTVHGGLTAARLAKSTPLFPSGELFCSGSGALTCTPAGQRAPVIPSGMTAIAGYVHQNIRVTDSGAVIVLSEATPAVAPLAG